MKVKANFRLSEESAAALDRLLAYYKEILPDTNRTDIVNKAIIDLDKRITAEQDRKSKK